MSSGNYSIIDGITTSSPSPSTTTAPPSTTTAPPSTTTSPPSTTTAPPSNTTAPPSSTTAPPSSTTAPPSLTTAPPSSTTAPPSLTIAPPSSTTAPLSRTALPSDYNYLTEYIDVASSSVGSLFGIFIFLIIFGWMISGLLGFIMALICLFYNSSAEEKIIGILASLILGPFFWLYYIYSDNYCKKY